MGALVYNPFRKIGKTKVYFITLESHNQELENFTTRHRYLVLYPQESLKSVNSDRNYFLRLSLLITQIAALMFFRRGTSSQIPDELGYSICHLAWHLSVNDNFYLCMFLLKHGHCLFSLHRFIKLRICDIRKSLTLQPGPSVLGKRVMVTDPATRPTRTR